MGFGKNMDNVDMVAWIYNSETSYIQQDLYSTGE